VDYCVDLVVKLGVRRGCEMATKQAVLKLVEKLGCSIDLDRDYIGVMAPKGKVFGDYMHYSGYGIGSFGDYKKSEVWNNLYYELQSMRDCEGGCNDGCKEYNESRKDSK